MSPTPKSPAISQSNRNLIYLYLYLIEHVTEVELLKSEKRDDNEQENILNE